MGRSVEFAGRALGRERHICAFFNSLDEKHRVLRSFIMEGCDRDEQFLLELRERRAARRRVSVAR